MYYGKTVGIDWNFLVWYEVAKMAKKVFLLVFIQISYVFASINDDLYKYSKAGDTQNVQGMLELGADPNYRTWFTKETPLAAAIKGYYKRIVDILIEAGADVHLPTLSTSPLSLAFEYGAPLVIIRSLLEAGAKLTDHVFSRRYSLFPLIEVSYAPRGSRLRQPILRWIAFHDRLDIVDLIIEVGVDIDTQTPKGKNTLLMFATKFSRREMVEKLLAAGADPTIRNAKGETAASIDRHNPTSPILRSLIASCHKRTTSMGRFDL